MPYFNTKFDDFTGISLNINNNKQYRNSNNNVRQSVSTVNPSFPHLSNYH